MPPITPLGWFHTIIAIVALISGAWCLWRYKFVRADKLSGQVYLGATFLAAASSLFIFNQGLGFGPAHALGVLTLLALAGGFVVKWIGLLRPIADYLQALCWSSTFLFHMIPAITDGLRRLPPSDPVVDRFDHPLIQGFYLLFLGLFVIGYTAQVIWLRRHGGSIKAAD